MAAHIVIVGAGPAGLSAALAAHAHGCTVTVLDEAAAPGGQIFRQRTAHTAAGTFASRSEARRKSILLDRFRAASGAINYIASAQVLSAFEGPEIQYTHQNVTRRLRPDAVILATGLRERAMPFEGWTLPGVMTAGGAQSILKSGGVLPGSRIAVAGAGALPLAVTAQMIRAGAKPAVMAMLHPLRSLARRPAALMAGFPAVIEGAGYIATVLGAGTRQLPRHVPIRAAGDGKLEEVTFVKVDRSGRPIGGSEKTYSADCLLVNYGFEANAELAAMLGTRLTHDSISGWHPATDSFGRTSRPGVYACGDGAGLQGAYAAQADGFITGTAAAAALKGKDINGADRELRHWQKIRSRHLAFQSALRHNLSIPDGLWEISKPDTVVCRCEGIKRHQIESAIGRGHRSLNAVKRNTRCGMGWCGGRSCLHSVSAFVERATGAPPEQPMTARAPVRPVSISDLARSNSSGGTDDH